MTTFLRLQTEVLALKNNGNKLQVNNEDAVNKNVYKQGNDFKMFDNDDELP